LICVVTEHKTGLPLSSHCNPWCTSDSSEQPRSFPHQPSLSLSLYSRTGFKQQTRVTAGRQLLSRNLLSLPPHARQATLPAAHYVPATQYHEQVLSQAVESERSPLLGSPRRRGQRLHAIVDRPTFLTPSISHRLGVSSQHQGLHRCARDGFLGPPSELVRLTRILQPPPIILNLRL
jgi:hypothetical protein